MKRSIFILFVTGFVVCLGIVCADARSVLSPIKVSGVVDRSVIGGQGLRVVSIWDNRKVTTIAADGSFTTVVSNQRPQKISLADSSGATRALAIVLPRESGAIRFDAASTAEAVLFQDSGSFGNIADVEKLLARIKNDPSFEKLSVFLKASLLSRSLEELSSDNKYIELVENCNSQIFGQDQRAIREKLSSAEGRLKTLLE